MGNGRPCHRDDLRLQNSCQSHVRLYADTADHAVFQRRDLADSDDVYVWPDGLHPKIRLSEMHSCLLVLMGVRVDGAKELIASAEGLRESTRVGDSAMGLWRALAEVFPQARHQRCGVYKTRNITVAHAGTAVLIVPAGRSVAVRTCSG